MRAFLQKSAQILSSLGVNFIPAGGWFFEGWSAGTTLGVYWFENVAASLLVAWRIQIHRRVAPCRGHVHYQPRKAAKRGAAGSFLAYFLPSSLIFSAAHGFFLAMFVFVLTMNGHGAEVGVDWRSLLEGCGLVLALLLAGFAIDLWSLRNKSFAWIERMAELNLSRVVLVHLTIIFGLAAAAFTGVNKAFFMVFIGLKTLSDLAGHLPQWNPAVPPAWLCRVMEKLPNAYPGKTFAEFWVDDKKEEVARLAANEKPA
jgi:hypothetical protein